VNRVALCIALLIALCAAACSSSRPATPQPINPTALPRLDAFHDSTLVVTIPPQPTAPPSGAVFDDGGKPESAIYRVTITAPPTATFGWLPAANTWSSLSADEKPRGIGPWVVLVRTPRESNAKTITVAGRQYALNWLPDTSMLPVPNEEAPEPLLNPWPPIADERTRNDTALLERIRSEAANPLTRWRHNLLLHGLAPVASQQTETPPFKDPVIEAIARQNEDRWRVALAWLWSADPELAWRVKSRLAAVVDFGAGVYAPAWSLDHTGMDLLLSNLLDSSITPQRRSELARAWLLDQPAGIAWIMDDAGVLDEVRRTPVAAIGFANLTDIATRVWVESQVRDDSDFVPVLSMSTLKMLVPMAACESPNVVAAQLIAHVSRASLPLTSLCDRIPVRPPGLNIGPLLSDYTMQGWQKGPVGLESLSPPAQWSTAALLHRPAQDPAAPESTVESRRWELLVECRMAPDLTDPTTLKRERVVFYFGPSAKPSTAWQVDLAGNVTSILPPDPLLPAELRPDNFVVPITRASDRWSFRISLPPGSIEADSTLRMGVIRHDARGSRSAWPRALLPWQREPGRAALKTSAWTDLQAP